MQWLGRQCGQPQCFSCDHVVAPLQGEHGCALHPGSHAFPTATAALLLARQVIFCWQGNAPAAAQPVLEVP